MKVNLGCGRFPLEGYVNVDKRDLPGVDIVADLTNKWPWEDGSVDVVRASHVFEHIPSQHVCHFMAEAHRVLSLHGVLDITVPHGEHANARIDPTHVRQCLPDTLEFWTGNPNYESYGPRFGERVLIESDDELRWLLMKEVPA